MSQPIWNKAWHLTHMLCFYYPTVNAPLTQTIYLGSAFKKIIYLIKYIHLVTSLLGLQLQLLTIATPVYSVSMEHCTLESHAIPIYSLELREQDLRESLTSCIKKEGVQLLRCPVMQL